jgi:hypothetical protein
MSTFIELVQELHEEVGAAGSAPSTVVAQRGEAKRFVNWIRRADRYVQNLWTNWKFLRSAYDENTTALSVDMPILQGASFWDEKTFKLYDPDSGEPYFLEIVEYDAIKSEERDDSVSTPYRLIVMNDGTLEAEPTPDQVYRVTGDAYLAPIDLDLDADVSKIPEQFHDVILARALILYANHENAPEIKTQGQEMYTEVLERLQNKQLPNKHQAQFRTGGSFEVIGSQ